MREIEFKAWDKRTNKIYPVSAISSSNKKVYIAVECDGEDDKYVQIRSFDDVILMQDTGKKDKNGKKIFEGHILPFKLHNGSIENYVITWEGTRLWALNKDKSNFIDEELWCESEIIGNIYENGDLLK